MEEQRQRNLVKINSDISGRLLDALYMLEILDDIADCSAKEGLLINKIKNYIKDSFDDIELCRKMISVPY